MADSVETIYEGKFLRVRRKGHWEYVERRKVSGIVGIVAITPAGKLILVEQFRAPLGRDVIELPAGLAGDVAGQETEEMANAARRELLEETGYEAADMVEVAEGPPSAGLSTEVITLFRATGLKKTGDGGGDASEKITVHEVPLADVREWLHAQAAAGKAIDIKVWAGLYFVSGVVSVETAKEGGKKRR